MPSPKTPEADDIIVGSNIRQMRLISKMSQQTLGDKIGVTFQQVQKYEKGTNRVSASKITSMARVFGCNVIEFFKGIDQDGTGEHQPPQLIDMSKDAVDLARDFHSIKNPKHRRAIKAVLNDLMDAYYAAEMAANAEPATAVVNESRLKVAN